MAEHDLEGELDAFLAGHEAELIDFRRDLHAHPETGYHEYRTTRRIALRLEAAGLRPMVLPKGTGLMVDIGGRVSRRAAGRAAGRHRRAADHRREGRPLPVHESRRVPRLRPRRAHHRS